VSIEIAALNLQLPILVKTSPELIDNGVVYLSTSTKIGESGNGVL
jgi:sortase (surface protein transpeptidase)